MATAKPTNTLSARRRAKRIAVMAVVAAVLAIAWFWGPLSARAVTATSYGARVACGCRFIEGRPLSQCKDDFMPGMGFVFLSEDTARKSVTARFPPLSSQTVIWRKGEGCMPDPWDN